MEGGRWRENGDNLHLEIGPSSAVSFPILLLLLLLLLLLTVYRSFNTSD